VRDTGFEIHIVDDATIRHQRSTTMSRFYVEARKANAASAMQYFQKHYGKPGLKRLRRWMMAALSIRIIATTLASWFGGDLPRLRAEGARAERQVYRQGLPGMSLRIMHVLASPHLGGAEQVCLWLAKAQMDRGYDVKLFVLARGRPSDVATETAIPTVLAGLPDVAIVGKRVFRRKAAESFQTCRN